MHVLTEVSHISRPGHLTDSPTKRSGQCCSVSCALHRVSFGILRALRHSQAQNSKRHRRGMWEDTSEHDAHRHVGGNRQRAASENRTTDWVQILMTLHLQAICVVWSSPLHQIPSAQVRRLEAFEFIRVEPTCLRRQFGRVHSTA